ncbi:MAG TPA: MMPL family transporter, partial [Candidatus Limnocylindrales bacterium]|nr:MMPL family transporter [Candidatus Limnocylindrales bacterium]
FRPSAQLLAMSKQFAVPVDPAAGLKKLLDPQTTTGLRSAAEYVRAVARAYPDLSASGSLTEAAADLSLMPYTIDQLRIAMGTSNEVDLEVARGLIAETSARIPTELAALSTAFAARTDDYFIPVGLSGTGQASLDATRAAYLSADSTITRLYAITADDAYSPGAFDTVGGIREALASEVGAYGPEATIVVGGQTALQRDLQTTIDADFLRVAALTVLGVLIVLALLLRSLVAPLYLVGTVLLSYLCTLGIGTILFQGVLGQSGMNYFLPLMVFVLLVALGSDYNIFLMSRVREESEARGTSDGIRAASARTGAVITSAGVILAGTFLAMVASPLTVLFQVGIMVAVGVLIDTFIVRSLLVPAITTILGDAAWWPFGRRGAPPASTQRPVSTVAPGRS